MGSRVRDRVPPVKLNQLLLFLLLFLLTILVLIAVRDLGSGLRRFC